MDDHLLFKAKEHPSKERHHLRFDKIPAGFVRYRQKKCPFQIKEGDTYTTERIELVVLTATGYGFSGPRRIGAAEWDIPKDELGSIIAYRVAGAD